MPPRFDTVGTTRCHPDVIQWVQQDAIQMWYSGYN